MLVGAKNEEWYLIVLVRIDIPCYEFTALFCQ